MLRFPGLLLLAHACAGAAAPPPIASAPSASLPGTSTPVHIAAPAPAVPLAATIATPGSPLPEGTGRIVTTTPVTRIVPHGVVWDEHAYHKLPGHAALLVDGTLERRFVLCEIDVTTPQLLAKCRGSNAAEYQTRHRGELQTNALWRWMTIATVVTDVAIEPAQLAKVQKSVDASQPLPAHPGLLVMDYTSMTLQEEIVPFGCEGANGHPCDPIPHKTGRMLRVPVTTSVAVLAGRTLSPDSPVASQVLPLVGWDDDAYHLDLLMMHTSPEVHAPRLNHATLSAAAARETLAYLARVDETNPDVRLALAFDRMLIAGHLGDPELITRADTHLQVELKVRRTQNLPIDPVTALALASAEPWFAILRKGRLQRKAPAHLEIAIERRPW